MEAITQWPFHLLPLFNLCKASCAASILCVQTSQACEAPPPACQQQCPCCTRTFPPTTRGTQSLLSHLSVLHIARCDPPPSSSFLSLVRRWICARCRRLRPTGQPCKTCGAHEHPSQPQPSLRCPFSACLASQTSFPQWASPEGLINHINHFHLARGETPSLEYMDSIGCTICRSCSILTFRSGCPSCRGRSRGVPEVSSTCCSAMLAPAPHTTFNVPLNEVLRIKAPSIRHLACPLVRSIYSGTALFQSRSQPHCLDSYIVLS